MTEKEFIPNIKQITLNKLLVGMLTKTLQMDVKTHFLQRLI